METIVVIVVIVVILRLSGVYNRIANVVSRTYQLPLMALINDSDLPPEYQEFHRSASRPLLEMGFSYAGCLRQKAIEHGADNSLYIALFHTR